MTKKELSQLYYLKKEAKHLRDKIAELECAATGSSPRITGVPIGYGYSNKVADYAVEINDLKEMLERQLRKCICEMKRINEYIETIEDSQIRIIIGLRYVQGLTWRQVAFRIGGGNTESGVKKMVYRYLGREVGR